MSNLIVLPKSTSPATAPTVVPALRTTYENVTATLQRFNDCMDLGTRRGALDHHGQPLLRTLARLSGAVAALHPFGPDRAAFADKAAQPLREIADNSSSPLLAVALGAEAALWKETLSRKRIVSASAGPVLDALIAGASEADDADVARVQRWTKVRNAAQEAIADGSYHWFIQTFETLPEEDRAAVTPSLRDLFFHGDRPRVRFFGFHEAEALRRTLDAALVAPPTRISAALRVNEDAGAPRSLQTVVEELERHLAPTVAKRESTRGEALTGLVTFLGSRAFAPIEVAMFARRAATTLLDLDTQKIHASDLRRELATLIERAKQLPDEVQQLAARLDGERPKSTT